MLMMTNITNYLKAAGGWAGDGGRGGECKH